MPASDQLLLTFEFIPVATWGVSLAKLLRRSEWRALRRDVFEKASGSCQVCGGRGESHPLECHETWEFDDSRAIQQLTGFLALCPDCHAAKHFGRVEPDRALTVLRHVCRVNQWTQKVAMEELQKASELWLQRSSRMWSVDLSMVGIELDIPHTDFRVVQRHEKAPQEPGWTLVTKALLGSASIWARDAA